MPIYTSEVKSRPAVSKTTGTSNSGIGSGFTVTGGNATYTGYKNINTAINLGSTGTQHMSGQVGLVVLGGDGVLQISEQIPGGSKLVVNFWATLGNIYANHSASDDASSDDLAFQNATASNFSDAVNISTIQFSKSSTNTDPTSLADCPNSGAAVIHFDDLPSSNTLHFFQIVVDSVPSSGGGRYYRLKKGGDTDGDTIGIFAFTYTYSETDLNEEGKITSNKDIVLQVDANQSSDADTSKFSFVAGDGTEVANIDESGVLQLGGNIIKASDGGSTITMDTSDNVTIGGELQVGGGLIKSGNGNGAIQIANTGRVKFGYNFGGDGEPQTNIVNVYHNGNNGPGSGGGDGITIALAGTTEHGNFLGGVAFDSGDGNPPVGALSGSAYIGGVAAQDHSTSDKGGHLVMGTTPINDMDDVESIERMRITSEGDIHFPHLYDLSIGNNGRHVQSRSRNFVFKKEHVDGTSGGSRDEVVVRSMSSGFRLGRTSTAVLTGGGTIPYLEMKAGTSLSSHEGSFLYDEEIAVGEEVEFYSWIIRGGPASGTSKTSLGTSGYLAFLICFSNESNLSTFLDPNSLVQISNNDFQELPNSCIISPWSAGSGAREGGKVDTSGVSNNVLTHGEKYQGATTFLGTDNLGYDTIHTYHEYIDNARQGNVTDFVHARLDGSVIGQAPGNEQPEGIQRWKGGGRLYGDQIPEGTPKQNTLFSGGSSAYDCWKSQFRIRIKNTLSYPFYLRLFSYGSASNQYVSFFAPKFRKVSKVGNGIGIATQHPQHALDMYNIGGQTIAMTVLERAHPDVATDQYFQLTTSLARVEALVYESGETTNKYKEVAKIRFIVPSSGAVEIQVNFWAHNYATGHAQILGALKDPDTGLYDNPEVGLGAFAGSGTVSSPDRLVHSFVLRGLKPGAVLSRELWLRKEGGAGGTDPHVRVKWGRHSDGSSTGWGQLIMKAVTVPAMIQENFHHEDVTDA